MESLLEASLAFLPALLMTSVRVGTVLASLPAPLGTGSPVQVRVGLSLALAGVLTAARWGNEPPLALEPLALATAGLGEMAVGAVIGLTARVTLAAAEVAGNLVGSAMGLGFSGTIDPSFGEEALPTGTMLGSFAVLIFFVLGGHHVTIEALAVSLQTAPLGAAWTAVVHEGVIEIGVDLAAQGLRIASPVVGTMFLVQIGMSLVSRAAPRLQVFALTFGVTAAVGTLVLFVSAPSIAFALERQVGLLREALMSALGVG